MQVTLGDQTNPTVSDSQHAILSREIQAILVNGSERRQVFLHFGNMKGLIEDQIGGGFLLDAQIELANS